jgi:hypothetical protein
LKQAMTKLFGASRVAERPAPTLRPSVRLGCEGLEDRVNPAGWLDDYAAWFDRNIGGSWYNSTVGAVTDWTVHAVGFTDETLATASDWQLLGGTAVVAVPVGIGLFVVGEVVLGVGTFGSAAATTTAEASGVAAVQAQIAQDQQHVNYWAQFAENVPASSPLGQLATRQLLGWRAHLEGLQTVLRHIQ